MPLIPGENTMRPSYVHTGGFDMAIRLRTVNGVRIALCAVESDPKPGDVYLDDADHYALAAKFCQDWQGQVISWSYEDIWKIMESQKVRDAEIELQKWIDGGYKTVMVRET